MTLQEIKQAMEGLGHRDLRELQAHLIRLRHNTPEWKRATARKIRAVQAGKGIPIEELEARFARGQTAAYQLTAVPHSACRIIRAAGLRWGRGGRPSRRDRGRT